MLVLLFSKVYRAQQCNRSNSLAIISKQISLCNREVQQVLIPGHFDADFNPFRIEKSHMKVYYII